MAESNVSIKLRVVDNEISAVGHHTSLNETGNSCSIQLVTTSASMEDCDYLDVISDKLISGEMPMTANNSKSDSDLDVARIDVQSQRVQLRQCQESNSATRADGDMYMTAINDSNDHVYAIVNADSDLTERVITHCKLVPHQLNFVCTFRAFV